MTEPLSESRICKHAVAARVAKRIGASQEMIARIRAANEAERHEKNISKMSMRKGQTTSQMPRVATGMRMWPAREKAK